MEDLIASLRIGTRLRIHDRPYVCFSRFAFDRWDEIFVLHDVRFPLDHSASLKTLLESTLIDLHRLGCVWLEDDRDVPPPGPAAPSPVIARRAPEIVPAS